MTLFSDKSFDSKFFTLKKCLQSYLPVALSLFMLVTIERNVVTDGGNDRFYGLPLPYITSSFGYSFHYNVYLLAMLFNLLFYSAATVAAFKVVEKLGFKLKINRIFLVIGILICMFWIVTFVFTTQDSSFYIKTDTEYKTVSKKLVFGFRP